MALESTKKLLDYLLILFFFILSSVKSFEMLPNHNGHGFISELFAAYNRYIFVALTNEKLFLYYIVDLMQIFFLIQ